MGVRLYRVRSVSTDDARLQVIDAIERYHISGMDDCPTVAAVYNLYDGSIENFDSSMTDFIAKHSTVEDLNQYFSERHGLDAYQTHKKWAIEILSKDEIGNNLNRIRECMIYLSFEKDKQGKRIDVLKDFISYEEDIYYEGIDELDTWQSEEANPKSKQRLVLCWVPN